MLESVCVLTKLSVQSHPIHSKSNESLNVSFTLAHLSDAHLSGLRKREVFKHFKFKRLIGAVSWFVNRKNKHKLNIANAVRDSISDAKVDHVALTGDLVNIATWNEFPAAANWVKSFGAVDRLSFVPGNHDTYVAVPWDQGLAHLAPWMKPDRHEANAEATLFPYVRMRRSIALIGLNSGRPQNYFSASGTLGEPQLRDLQHILAMLGQQGFYRVVMIHHPPLPGLAKPRKALTDAAALQKILKQEGCELVLHGHSHCSMLNWLETKSGPAPVVGVPSASFQGDSRHEPAGWNNYHIRRQQGRWLTDMTPYRWSKAKSRIEQGQTTTLSPPSSAKL
jgi:3',5'-cyclic AMP phosphodiesterase CpdA